MMPDSIRHIALGLAVLALAACSSQAEVATTPRVARVAPIQNAGAQALSVYPGEVHARYESALGFRVGGKIAVRKVDMGAVVKQGQVLAELDPNDLELAHASAKATLSSAEAALRLAQSEYDRYASLRERQFIAQLALDSKRSALDAARAHVAEARAALAAAANQRDYAALRADADGVVTAIHAEVGQVVATGQPVMTLARDGTREIEINVPEQAIAQVSAGTPARIELWTEDGQHHAAHVREVAPAADAVTRTFRVRVSFDGEDAPARLGQTARVYFAANAEDGQFLVPLSAVHEQAGQAALWQVDAKTRQIHLAPVAIRSYGESGAIVAGKLLANDWIVTAGVHRLREGEVILPVDADNRRVNL